MFFTDNIYDFLIPLLGGMILDSLLGDPRCLPHPIRWFGSWIAFFDRKLNRGNHKKAKGIFTALFLVFFVIGIWCGADYLLNPYPIFSILFNTLFFFYAIGNRSLISEAWKVEKEVQKGDLSASRKQLSWIVGRDTSQLSFHQIRTAVLETLAENLSDGVIAPLLFYALGDVPLMMGYKMINTLDSMIGYKNEKYKEFGWFAARILDDAANYIPARFTALLIALLPPSKRTFRFIRTYARQHASPNSGFPESAMAGVLDCRFGGPNIYHGKVVEKPYIGENDRELTHSDFRKAVSVNIRVAFFTVLLIVVVFLLLFGF